MTLRFLDKLFTKETLLRSTLYGTKEFSALDPRKIAAIKGKVAKIVYFVRYVLGNIIDNNLNVH